MTYNIHSRDYLNRAKILLHRDDLASRFYAAFELRSGIEARLQEYVEAHKEKVGLKKLNWRIADLVKDLEKAFKHGEKIIALTFIDKSTSESIARVYYTPVPASLQTLGGKMGGYLHAMLKYRPPNDSWWKELDSCLKEACDQLQCATYGALLGPPLWKPKTGESKLFIEACQGDEQLNLPTELITGGYKGTIKVEYYDELATALDG